jgi:hypothetical protein
LIHIAMITMLAAGRVLSTEFTETQLRVRTWRRLLHSSHDCLTDDARDQLRLEAK